MPYCPRSYELTAPYRNVTGAAFDNQFLVKYARAIEVSYMIRGIRTEGDYEFERRMRYLNSDLDPDITTIFFIPPREIAEISSSTIKGLVGPEGWEAVVACYVRAVVYHALIERFGASKNTPVDSQSAFLLPRSRRAPGFLPDFLDLRVLSG